MNTADVLVLGGPPGAGKTTVSALIADGWNPSVRLKADLFWDEFICRGWIAPWKPESHDQNCTVLRAVAAAAAEYAKGTYPVVLDGTVGPWFVDLIGEVFSDRDVAWQYAILLPSHEETVERNQLRSAEERVEEAVIDKMHGEFTAHVNGFEKYVVDSTHLDAEATAVLVCNKIQGRELEIR